MLCAQDSGIASRGKHCESLERNVVSPLKEVSFGRRITHFRRDFVRSGGD